MSFRKRGEVLNGGGVPGRTAPNRVVGSAPGRAVPTRVIGGAVPGRQGSAIIRRGDPSESGSRNHSGLPVRGFTPGTTTESIPIEKLTGMHLHNTLDSEKPKIDLEHPGVRPSPVSANLVTSTGCMDLDRVLTHMGLPLGTSLLVEEKGTTDFGSILCKLFAAQGVMHSRVNSSNINGNTHLIVLSLNQMFGKELPGVYKGSKKEVKKSLINEEKKKLSVSNLNEQKSAPTRYTDLKIAWKYKYVDEMKQGKDGRVDVNKGDFKDYNNQFDITSRLMPAPTPSEITFISPIQPLPTILTQIERTIKQHENQLIRIIIPSFLHPAMYPPKMFALSNSISLLHGIKGIVKKNRESCVLLATTSTDILNTLLNIQIENLFDAVINLEPFQQDMLNFLERTYKTQPNKVQHGLLHVLKLPVFSDRGEMHVRKSEWAFRNGRKKFEIEPWSIPVDDTDDVQSKPDAHNHNHEHDHATDSAAPKNTKISLEY